MSVTDHELVRWLDGLLDAPDAAWVRERVETVPAIAAPPGIGVRSSVCGLRIYQQTLS